MKKVSGAARNKKQFKLTANLPHQKPFKGIKKSGDESFDYNSAQVFLDDVIKLSKTSPVNMIYQ